MAMQLRHTIRNFFAVLLIVVFSLQAGMGLYLHNAFHLKNSSSNTSAGSTEIKLACSCIADFYLPYTEVLAQKVAQPPSIFENHNYSFTSSVLFTFSVFHSLRAPPIYS
jgi:hypothetical protein